MAKIIDLKWNAHSANFSKNLSILRDQQLYTDVTISCGNQFYPAHRLVLSSCSSFFARAFEEVDCKSPALLLHGVDQLILEHLLMFMYDGQVTIPQDVLPQFIKVAHWLGMKGMDVPTACSEVITQECYQHPDQPSNETEPNKYLDLWTQILTSLVNKDKENPSYEEMTTALRQIISKAGNYCEENAIRDVTVSNVTSLSQDLDSQSKFGYNIDSCFEPNTVIKNEDSSFMIDLETNELDPHSPITPYSAGSRNTFDCGFLEPSNNFEGCTLEPNNDFEGWTDSERSLSELLISRQRNIILNSASAAEERESDLSLEQSLEGGGRADTPPKRKKYWCQHCQSRFCEYEDLTSHLCIQRQYICNICKKGFMNSRLYVMHMKHHDSGSEIFCNACDFTSANKKGLARHKAVMHNDSRSSVWICRQCGFKSSHERGFKRHITCKHSKKKDKKKFSLPQDLISTNKSESTVSVYNCNKCNFTSNCTVGLKRHVTCKHSNLHIPEIDVLPDQDGYIGKGIHKDACSGGEVIIETDVGYEQVQAVDCGAQQEVSSHSEQYVDRGAEQEVSYLSEKRSECGFKLEGNGNTTQDIDDGTENYFIIKATQEVVTGTKQDVDSNEEHGDDLREKNTSITVYEDQYHCNLCGFVSIYKRGFKKHMSCTHKLPILNKRNQEGTRFAFD
ncbi:hypothetical protein SK128_026730 [Halocaridina rubra]|uniref:Uncharacterized protein n=1 Tax=Halocaridina rubra TaxID=373956 RepID=A0AAN8X103_HALRR